MLKGSSNLLANIMLLLQLFSLQARANDNTIGNTNPPGASQKALVNIS